MSKAWILESLLIACILGWCAAGEYCSDVRYCRHYSECRQKMIINLRTNRLATCGDYEVCCDLRDETSTPTPTSPTSDIPPPSSVTQPSDQFPCGFANPNGLENGQRLEGYAKHGEFPWAVAVFNKEKYIGGGSLVAPDVVLSVHHLLDDVSMTDIRIRAGDWNLNSEIERFVTQERAVSRIETHDNFDIRRGLNNVALFFLDKPFEVSDNIRTICLPNSGSSYQEDGCIMAGWGKKNYLDRRCSSKMKKIQVPLVSRDDCQNRLRTTLLGRGFVLAEGLRCAGGGKYDACTGDGGSSLFCPMTDAPNRYVQVGIVNYGIDCGQLGIPGVYTDVVHFQNWILQKMDIEVYPAMGNYR